jgi:CHRD domain
MTAVALLGWIASATLVQAAPISFSVPLTGGQEVPAVSTSGTGTADLTYVPSTRVVTGPITFGGLSGTPTMGHFHGAAPEGTNAGVQVWLTDKGHPVSSPISGQATLTPVEAEQFMAGDIDINLHSTAHPAGELRGEVVPPKS